MRKRRRGRRKRQSKARSKSLFKLRPLLKFKLKLRPFGKARLAKINLLLPLLVFGLLIYSLHSFQGSHWLRRVQMFVRDQTGFQKVALAPSRLPFHKPKIVFVIDDIGHTLDHYKLLERLGNQVTYAILPLLPYSETFSEMSQRTGAEVLLHLPMEAEDGTIPGPGLMAERMSPFHLRDLLGRNLDSVPHRVGVNNHMGSRGTANPVLMEIILKELKKRRLFFLDSYTTPDTVSFEIGKKIGLGVLRRDVFLDNTDSPSAIRKEIEQLAFVARQNGYAIGIGHYRYNTLKVLEEEMPRLREEGFEIASLSELLQFKSKR